MVRVYGTRGYDIMELPAARIKASSGRLVLVDRCCVITVVSVASRFGMQLVFQSFNRFGPFQWSNDSQACEGQGDR